MKKFANPIKTSIDAILDAPKLNPQVSPSPSNTATSSSAPTTLTTKSSPRPVPGKQPSWIGPPKPATLDSRNMKHPVTVEYAHAGLQPPVFVCTSLSEPQWQPIEMDKEKRANGEYRFFKTFSAAEGEYQYKFRLGPGDWWVTDERKPVVDDGAGNKNNLMTVKAPGASAIAAPTPSDRPRVTSGRSIPQPTDDSEPHQRMEASKKTTDAAQASKTHNAPRSPAGPSRANKPHGIDLPVGMGNLDDIPTPGSAPGMEHETEPELASSYQHQDASVHHAHPLDHPLGSPTDNMPDAAPLMKHESFAAPIETKHEVAPLMKHESFVGLDEMEEKDQIAVDDFLDESAVDDDDGPPLLRHESLAPESDEQTQAPLMRHESLALGQHGEHPRSALRPSGSSMTSSHSSQEDAVAPEPDPNDKSLEHFPHDRRGIFSHIHRASVHAADHEARDVIQPSKRSPHSGPSSPIASLPSVQEDEDEELEGLREQERQEYEREQETGEELDPMAEERPAAPLTPPLTPEESEKTVDSAPDTTGIDDANGATGGMKDKHIVREYEQKHGPVHTMIDFVRHPTAWFTFAGIAVAVAAGVYKLRYA